MLVESPIVSRTRHSRTNGRTIASRDQGSVAAVDDDAPYVTVVVDHLLGSIESYGPLPAPRAVRILTDLRALLAADGIADVSVTACPLHAPGRPPHPEDP